MQTRKSKKNEGRVSDCNRKIEGKYANFFKVGYNAFEFVIDFGQNYSENDQAEPYTRIIIAPAYAKAMLDTLKASIEKYEQKYGTLHQITSVGHNEIKKK